MRRKLFGAVGGVAALAAAAGGALAASRRHRDAQFYRDLIGQLQMTAAAFRGRRDVAIHAGVTSEVALDVMTPHEDFDVVQGGLAVEVEVGLPDNMDVTRLEVTFFGSAHTLFMLHKRLMASQDPRLALEDVGTIDSEPNGSQLKFTLLVSDISDAQAANLQQKLS